MSEDHGRWPPLAEGMALGVAGNMTGHLEQAGEAADFAEVRAAADRPKGMFPIYAPGVEHRLGTWPFSSTYLVLPAEVANVQPEPELALRCRLTYDAGGVSGIEAVAFAAADDTSLRRPAAKIHHKKNWGPAAKGLSETWLPLDRFDAQGALHAMRLGCWLVRDGVCQAYGEDSAVRDYGTHYRDLVDWMIDRLRCQRSSGPLDDLSAWLDRAQRPEWSVISIGATRYTALGERTFVQAGDSVVVVVYDGRVQSPDEVADAVASGVRQLPGASLLRRAVVAAADAPTASG